MSNSKAAEGVWQAPGYRSARVRARWTLVLLAVAGGLAVLEGFYFVLGAVWLRDYQPWTIQQTERLNTWGNIVDGITRAAAVASIVKLIALLMWLHRTVSNAPALGVGTPVTSPGWSVAWWFVPVANFWKPYAILRDLWSRYVDARRGLVWLVQTWWIAWLIGVAGTLVINRVFINSVVDVPSLQALLYWSAAVDALWLLGAIAGVAMVREIQLASDQKADALGLSLRAPGNPSAPFVAPAGTLAMPPPPAVTDTLAMPPPPAVTDTLAMGSTARATPPTKPSATPATRADVASTAAFCHLCGHRSVLGDRFCFSCGTPLRVS